MLVLKIFIIFAWLNAAATNIKIDAATIQGWQGQRLLA